MIQYYVEAVSLSYGSIVWPLVGAARKCDEPRNNKLKAEITLTATGLVCIASMIRGAAD